MAGEHLSGDVIALQYSFELTLEGSTQTVPFIFQKHSYKAGGVEVKEYKVGGQTIANPMQTKIGKHELEGLIATEGAAEYRSLFKKGAIVSNGAMPDWREANGPHFIEDFTFDDGIEDMSSIKVTISESKSGS